MIRRGQLSLRTIATFGTAAWLTFQPGTRAATASLVTFTIDDGNPAVAVRSDQEVTGTNEYKDYGLGTGQVGDLNYCVEARLAAGSTLFVRLNRKLDGSAGEQRCDTPDDQYGAGVQRQYLLEIRNSLACAELEANGYQPSPFNGSCVVTGGLNPRIRMGAVWAKNARFPVDFLTTKPLEDKATTVSYEIQSSGNATITPGPGDLTNVRTVSYSGNAKLVKFGSTVPSIATEAFALPFKMTFVRH